MKPDLTAQLQNVLSGRTAFGAVGFGPMSFPRDPAAFATLTRWTSRYLSQAYEPDDKTRTAFMRKLARFIIRAGYDDAYRYDYINAVAWFAARPEAARSKLSFGGAARLRNEALRAAHNADDSLIAGLVRLAMAVPEPPCPVLLQDRTFTLVELIHPRHLLRAGRSANNCLYRMAKGGEPPNPRYWQAMLDGLRIFAITRGATLCCLFSVHEGAHQEWECVHPPLRAHSLHRPNT